MNKSTCLVTVFTPTYNRSNLLGRLYDSLQNQTNYQFEWLVVDDGSTDNTKQLFDIWTKRDNPFSIRYYYSKNGGKHRAINQGVRLAKGKLFFIVDSDDFLLPNAIELLVSWDKDIPTGGNYAAISGNKGFPDYSLVGNTFNSYYLDCTYIDRKENNIIGDKAEAYYTNVLRKYPFPSFDNENFITERVVWDKIAYDGYLIRWYNQIIYICEYLEDGLSQNGDIIFKNNPRGTAYELLQRMDIYNFSFIEKIRSYYSFYILERNNLSFIDISNLLNISCIELFVVVLSAKIYRLLKIFHSGDKI